ncbi:MAG: ATP-dependent DNA helicase RecG [Acholeplasmataceae bacterium]|jgi:ATP-dependent DNA helicase RecG
MKLEDVNKIGKKTANQLRRNNIWSPYDLVMTFPKSYENYNIINFNEAKHNEVITIIGTIIKIESFKTKIHLIKLLVKVDQFQTSAVIFNQPFLLKSFKVDDEVLIKGKYNLYKNEIAVSSISKNLEKREITPKYNLDSVNDYVVGEAIRDILENNKVAIYETLPYEILNHFHLKGREETIKSIHLPQSIKELNEAFRRLKYEEALILQLKLQKGLLNRVKREPINYEISLVKEFIETIPYELTDDQKEVVNEIYRDFKNDYQTKRLIQGDVGSGKTIVAIIGMFGVLTANKQAVLMVPTEILANQQYETIKELLPNYNVELLTSKVSHKPKIYQKIESGEIDILVGTHAVASENVNFKDLGLIVIDEQHKFGVELRESLFKKSESANLIYLTATPIPRTLGIAMFGDLATSQIKSRPEFQKPITSKHYDVSKLDEIIKEVLETINRGEHVFIVVPAISSELKDFNIANTYEILNPIFKEKLFVLHGELSSDDRNDVIAQFSRSKGGVLLSTSMVEVGINLKTATLMIVLAAENFGLAQLHQLRGRVGRGELKSKFYTISSKEDVERLEILEKVNCGFKLSEYDLKLRGPGEFLGLKQSGILQAKYLDFSLDYQILLDARKLSLEIINNKKYQNDKSYYYINKVLSEE